MSVTKISNAQFEAAFDTHGLEKFLKSVQKDYRNFSQDAVKHGAVRVALAASAATRQAPMRRSVVGVKPGTRRRKGNISDRHEWYAKKPVGAGKFLYFGPIFALTKQIARRDERTLIKRRGLAKNAWKWMLKDIGAGRAQISNAAAFSTNRTKYMAVRNRIKTSHPNILLTDKLRYARMAFKTKGEATIFTIMQKAEGAMRGQLEKRVSGRNASRSGLHTG